MAEIKMGGKVIKTHDKKAKVKTKNKSKDENK